jgi:ketosteroid isomerase-like protein
MDTILNKKLVADFFTALNEQRMNDAFGYFAEDLHWWILGDIPVSGNYDKRKISLGLKLIFRSFDGFKFTLGEMTAEENRVSVIAESNAVRKSNSKKYNNHYHFLFSFENGKIKTVKEYFDTVHAVWIEESS